MKIPTADPILTPFAYSQPASVSVRSSTSPYVSSAPCQSGRTDGRGGGQGHDK